MRRFLDRDQFGRETYLHTDADGSAVIESVEDAEDIVEWNAHASQYLDKKKDMWFVGTLPLTICQQWAVDSNTKVFTKPWQKYAKAQLQKSEYRKLNPNNIKF